jgi:hypothetical protein
MNNDEAKKILSLYRPGTPDQTDPSFADARERAKPFPPPTKNPDPSDPELARWFQDHAASYVSIRKKFLEIPVPAGLEEQILAQVKATPANVIPLRPNVLYRVAAVVVLCLGLAAFYWHSYIKKGKFDEYRDFMAASALQPYNMLQTNNWQAVNAYLAGHDAPTNYVLPEGLSKATLVGCAMADWAGHHASMICFQSGQPLAAGHQFDLWFFVGDKSSLRGVPSDAAPVVAEVRNLTTASWSKDGKVYVLAGAGDESFLRKYF